MAANSVESDVGICAACLAPAHPARPGVHGVVGSRWYGVYGDTLWCTATSQPGGDDSPAFEGMVRDSVAQMTDDPLVVRFLHLNDDQPVPHPLQFIPFNGSWGETDMYGFGGTSIVETADGEGAVFYLVNANEQGLQGAGVARLALVSGAPTATQRLGNNGYWWPAGSTQYIYGRNTYLYIARVRAGDAYTLSAYEYWWGRSSGGGWKMGQPLTTGFGADTAVMWITRQGQVVWSEAYACYIYVHLGPWTPDVTVYTATPIKEGGTARFTYAGVVHPYLDPSGRTLTISYTNNNYIEIIRVAINL
ncbi:hypothetical protein AAE478_007934 [Parahypoxylon ruwenzoriense]